MAAVDPSKDTKSLLSDVVNEERAPADTKEELCEFLRIWRSEIIAKKEKNTGSEPDDSSKLLLVLKAKELYSKGITAERKGDAYEAMIFYRQATKLVPDIDQVYDFSRDYSDLNEGSVEPPQAVAEDQDEVEEAHIPEELTKPTFNSLQLKTSCFCEPRVATMKTHISALSNEVMLLILCWLVSSELHLHCLEQVSLVCRGFYILARDQVIWQKACKRLWKDIQLDNRGSSWRALYLKTPHVHFHGCYISKYSYVRSGEPSLDEMYTPFHVVHYYRFLRFFLNGTVVYLNSPDDPAVNVSKLVPSVDKHSSGIMSGRYKIIGSRVVVDITSSVYKPSMGGGGWKKAGHMEVSHETNLLMELNLKGRQWQRLSWVNYSISQHYKSTGKVCSSVIPIDDSMTCLYFSPVKSYYGSNRIISRPL